MYELAPPPFADRESALQGGKVTSPSPPFSQVSRRYDFHCKREEHQEESREALESPGRGGIPSGRAGKCQASPPPLDLTFRAATQAGGMTALTSPSVSNAAISSSFSAREALSHLIGLTLEDVQLDAAELRKERKGTP